MKSHDGYKCNQKWLQIGNAIENDCIRVKYYTKRNNGA